MAHALHNLLLLADSALPLGSFAFSSGLESFLAHTNQSQTATKPSSRSLESFNVFLDHSLQNLSSTALPYVMTAFNDPSALSKLDNDFDASIPCTVARRASVTQGRALITVWERALLPSIPSPSSENPELLQTLAQFTAATKTGPQNSRAAQNEHRMLSVATSTPNGHFAPLFGAICRAMNLSAADTAYVFLLNHAKALLSAAVRASVMGPYQAQMVLASSRMQEMIRACIERDRETLADNARVVVPAMDLWMGRHELLYSRIFNS